MNLKTEIISIDNTPYKDETGAVITLGRILSIVLISTRATDPLRTYLLTQKIAGKDEVELSAEEIVYLKEQIQLNARQEIPSYNAHILGQSMYFIDNKPE